MTDVNERVTAESERAAAENERVAAESGGVAAESERALIFLTPVLKPTIWGGRKLGTNWGYDLPDGPVGECWAISAHPHGDCVVAEGPLAGVTLSRLWAERRDLFGGLQGDRFPLLVKVIDAEDDLSVQVHPDDAYAREHENGSLGKHECWYILDAHPHAHIAIGQKVANRDEFARLAAARRWDDLVNEIFIWNGDFFDIKPGTLHAILGGTLLLEIQQSSDVTYRVYDYERRQPDGTLRETHLDKALDVIDYAAEAPTTGEVFSPEVDGLTQLLESDDFSVFRLRVDGARELAQPWPFLTVSVVAGEGTVTCGDARHDLRKGSHFIAPSACGPLVFEGKLEVVCSHV